MTRRFSFASAAIILAAFVPRPASALSIKEFRKFTPEQQSMFITGAVSMTAYTYATIGDTKKAGCIQRWYFAKVGVDTPGPNAVAVELVAAEQIDAEKYHVEGVILGLTDKVCGPATSTKLKP